MIKIKPILLGLPPKEANHILIRPFMDSTLSKDCNTYYEVVAVEVVENDAKRTILATGNCPISEEQYAEWGAENDFIEDIVLKKLGLERL